MRPGPVTVRIPEEDKERLTADAEKLGMSLAELLRTGAHIVAGFDENFWKSLRNYSRHTNLPESLVIQGIVTTWMAQKAAEQEVFPKSSGLILELAFTSSGPLPSKIMFENVKASHIHHLEDQKEAAIRLKKDKGTASKKDIAWLEKREEQQARLKRERENTGNNIEEGSKGALWGDELKRTIDDIKKKSQKQTD